MSTTRRSPSGSSVRVVRTADEDHVDVADVVQLARAGLAHADDGELGRGDLLTRETAPHRTDDRSTTRVRATQRDASSAAPAASASRAATAATTSTGDALSRS